MRDAVCASNVRQALTGCTTTLRLLSLERRQLGRAPDMLAAGFGARPASASASPDQLTLELGQAAKYSQHQPAVRCRSVGHASARDRNPAPFRVIASSVLSKSRVDR